MQIKRLMLANVRGFQQAEFEFESGMNLIVGVNGAGKSTVLDVLRIIFSQSMPKFTKTADKKILNFHRESDIYIGQQSLSVEVHFEMLQSYKHTILLQRESFKDNVEADEGQVRNQITDLHEIDSLTITNTEYVGTNSKPLMVYFSPHRSILDVKRRTARNNEAEAYVNALESRGLNIQELVSWWVVQEVIRSEKQPQLFPDSSANLLDILRETVAEFLGDESNLRSISEPRPSLIIDKIVDADRIAGTKKTITVDISLLSHGERSMIALIIDLARRLALVNPHLENPIRDGEAVVLIDELDLHLHPIWQSTICERLVRTFQNCQFIATTHSPQIVGEVSPENIILIRDGIVVPIHQSLGMDSNWILDFVMETPSRPSPYNNKIYEIENLIDSENYDDALKKIGELRDEIGEFPELARLQAQADMLSFLDDDESDE